MTGFPWRVARSPEDVVADPRASARELARVVRDGRREMDATNGESHQAAGALVRRALQHPNISPRTLRRMVAYWADAFLDSSTGAINVAEAAVGLGRLSGDPVGVYHKTVRRVGQSSRAIGALHLAAATPDMATSAAVLHEIAVLHLGTLHDGHDSWLARQVAAGTIPEPEAEARWRQFTGATVAQRHLLTATAGHPNLAPTTLQILWTAATSMMGATTAACVREAILSRPDCLPDLLAAACWGRSDRDAAVALANPACPDVDASWAALRSRTGEPAW